MGAVSPRCEGQASLSGSWIYRSERRPSQLAALGEPQGGDGWKVVI